jgi:hypothetical protein
MALETHEYTLEVYYSDTKETKYIVVKSTDILFLGYQNEKIILHDPQKDEYHLKWFNRELSCEQSVKIPRKNLDLSQLNKLEKFNDSIKLSNPISIKVDDYFNLCSDLQKKLYGINPDGTTYGIIHIYGR